MSIDTLASTSPPQPLEPTDPVVWYRDEGSSIPGDHAFGTTTDYLRSKCRQVRFTVLLSRVEGDVRPCVGCLAAVQPMPEGEARMMEGDR